MPSNTPAPSSPAPSQVVPHVECCPACGAALQGRSCKVYCVSPTCELQGRVIENCAGD